MVGLAADGIGLGGRDARQWVVGGEVEDVEDEERGGMGLEVGLVEGGGIGVGLWRRGGRWGCWRWGGRERRGVPGRGLAVV